MFKRYKKNSKGTNVPYADIYTQDEHKIQSSLIDKNAAFVVKRITNNGGEAYIVGGAVRDMLLGKKPKDFDIATSLTPRQIKKLFYNSRIIGKRFQIVHLYFGTKTIEVTTFRDGSSENSFGVLEQDAKNRDFTINSLYYDCNKDYIIDFNHAYQDVLKSRMRPLIPLKVSFIQDPVRMIRCLKYSVTTNSKIGFLLSKSIRKHSPRLETVSTSRTSEEMYKIFSSGYSSKIMSLMIEYELINYLMPHLSIYLEYDKVKKSLIELDNKVLTLKDADQSVKPQTIIYYLAKEIVTVNENLSSFEIKKDLLRQIKVLISPLTPPNVEVEMASIQILKEYGLSYQPKVKTPVAKAKPASSKLPTRPANRKYNKKSNAKKVSD